MQLHAPRRRGFRSPVFGLWRARRRAPERTIRLRTGLARRVLPIAVVAFLVLDVFLVLRLTANPSVPVRPDPAGDPPVVEDAPVGDPGAVLRGRGSRLGATFLSYRELARISRESDERRGRGSTDGSGTDGAEAVTASSSSDVVTSSGSTSSGSTSSGSDADSTGSDSSDSGSGSGDSETSDGSGSGGPGGSGTDDGGSDGGGSDGGSGGGGAGP